MEPLLHGALRPHERVRVVRGRAQQRDEEESPDPGGLRSVDEVEVAPEVHGRHGLGRPVGRRGRRRDDGVDVPARGDETVGIAKVAEDGLGAHGADEVQRLPAADQRPDDLPAVQQRPGDPAAQLPGGTDDEDHDVAPSTLATAASASPAASSTGSR